MADPVQAVKDIAKNFGPVNALRNVTLNIFKGKVHTLLGENGAGKSTLMKILAGVYQPTKGQIILNGQEVRIGSPSHSRALGIAIIFQELSLSNKISTRISSHQGTDLLTTESWLMIAGYYSLSWGLT